MVEDGDMCINRSAGAKAIQFFHFYCIYRFTIKQPFIQQQQICLKNIMNKNANTFIIVATSERD